MNMKKSTICLIGLGYVGLPLAHAFAKNGYRVLGFDISSRRIETLKQGADWTGELTTEQLKNVDITYSDKPEILKEADVIIVTVPTPVDENNLPDLTPVESASVTIGQNLKKGAIIVYESTVYPGVTEELCGPIIARESGLTCGVDFTLGYSPERINPGDKEHTVDKIIKVVAGQDEKTTDALVELYGSVITAGIHRAPSIKVAEMAKAIENAQRDINIAFINEIAVLSQHIGIQTKDVLDAAGTKWNFLRFKPGLVGGHCIGVDPYYLVEKAKQLGMTTHLITAGRSINDSMGMHVANQVLKQLKVPAKDARVLLLGITFKENIPDTRNSKVGDVAKTLTAAGCIVTAHDPNVSKEDLVRLGYTPGALEEGPFDAVLFLVPHKEYKTMTLDQLTSLVRDGGVLYDLKSLLKKEDVEAKNRVYVSL